MSLIFLCKFATKCREARDHLFSQAICKAPNINEREEFYAPSSVSSGTLPASNYLFHEFEDLRRRFYDLITEKVQNLVYKSPDDFMADLKLFAEKLHERNFNSASMDVLASTANRIALYLNGDVSMPTLSACLIPEREVSSIQKKFGAPNSRRLKAMARKGLIYHESSRDDLGSTATSQGTFRLSNTLENIVQRTTLDDSLTAVDGMQISFSLGKKYGKSSKKLFEENMPQEKKRVRFAEEISPGISSFESRESKIKEDKIRVKACGSLSSSKDDKKISKKDASVLSDLLVTVASSKSNSSSDSDRSLSSSNRSVKSCLKGTNYNASVVASGHLSSEPLPRRSSWKKGDTVFTSLTTWYIDISTCPYPNPSEWFVEGTVLSVMKFKHLTGNKSIKYQLYFPVLQVTCQKDKAFMRKYPIPQSALPVGSRVLTPEAMQEYETDAYQSKHLQVDNGTVVECEAPEGSEAPEFADEVDRTSHPMTVKKQRKKRKRILHVANEDRGEDSEPLPMAVRKRKYRRKQAHQVANDGEEGGGATAEVKNGRQRSQRKKLKDKAARVARRKRTKGRRRSVGLIHEIRSTGLVPDNNTSDMIRIPADLAIETDLFTTAELQEAEAELNLNLSEPVSFALDLPKYEPQRIAAALSSSSSLANSNIYYHGLNNLVDRSKRFCYPYGKESKKMEKTKRTTRRKKKAAAKKEKNNTVSSPVVTRVEVEAKGKAQQSVHIMHHDNDGNLIGEYFSWAEASKVTGKVYSSLRHHLLTHKLLTFIDGSILTLANPHDEETITTGLILVDLANGSFLSTEEKIEASSDSGPDVIAEHTATSPTSTIEADRTKTFSIEQTNWESHLI